MWAWILGFAKTSGGWIIAGISALAVLKLTRKVGNLESETTAANERSKDHEAIAVTEIERAHESADVRVDAIKVVNETQSDNAKLSDADIESKLREQWTRDKT